MFQQGIKGVDFVICNTDAQALQSNEEKESIEQPRRERKSFLDKLTERVKDFLDNAE
jgi:cell division GTPase FtsZ